MKKVFSITLLLSWCIFLFISGCGTSEKKLGEARIVQVYDLKEGIKGRHEWKTTIECLENGSRHTLQGKIGNVNDIYMSTWC